MSNYKESKIDLNLNFLLLFQRWKYNNFVKDKLLIFVRNYN